MIDAEDKESVEMYLNVVEDILYRLGSEYDKQGQSQKAEKLATAFNEVYEVRTGDLQEAERDE